MHTKYDYKQCVRELNCDTAGQEWTLALTTCVNASHIFTPGAYIQEAVFAPAFKCKVWSNLQFDCLKATPYANRFAFIDATGGLCQPIASNKPSYNETKLKRIMNYFIYVNDPTRENCHFQLGEDFDQTLLVIIQTSQS